MISDTDKKYLQRCVELATKALEEGNHPFGSILVAADGKILFEDHNRDGGGDRTRHPEFEVARWAANNLSPEQRASATVYTTGEHCAMCSGAHGQVGLGRIVYASSSQQLAQWLADLGAPPSPLKRLSIQDVVPGITVDGPEPSLSATIHRLHQSYHARHSPA